MRPVLAGWGGISPETAETARNVVEPLPGDAPLPEIAPDGDLGLAVVWTDRDGPLLIGIDGKKLHVVVNAKLQDAQYYDDIPFDGVAILQIILMTPKRPLRSPQGSAC